MIDQLRKLHRGKHLTEDEVRIAFEQIMTGATNPIQLGAFLALMATRLPTVDELVGAAGAMRQFVVPVKAPPEVIDTCGAGGAGSRIFNVSTTAALVAAACGLIVAKHGNMAVTSRSGSADVLRELGVNIVAPVEIQERSLREVGIAFCYAPRHHPAMKHVAEARRAVGFPTIFNLMGPLTNPAAARRQLVGVPAPELILPVAEALRRLGAERAMVVCGRDPASGPLCELSISGPTGMCLLDADEIKNVTLNPTDVGLEVTPSRDMEINTPAESAALIRRVLAGEKGPARDMVLMNAAAALWVGKAVKALPQGITRAAAAIDSGQAARVLEELRKITNETPAAI